MDIYRRGVDLARDTKHTRWLAPLLLAIDAALCVLIIAKVPYTEIDWKAYMQQIAQYRSGERDYTLIKGDTGPLVYPAAHVYIYNALYQVTDEGRDVFRAQCIFMVVYLAALNMVMNCYRMAHVPPYIFPLLILSKRLHSIFLLRLFNDCFAVVALFTAIFFFQKKIFTIGSVSYSFGVGVKMSMLLAGPAIGIILLQVLPFKRAFNALFLMAQVQFTLAVPFLSNWQGYLARSFELSRVFLYKWTVNWRFMSEERFLSQEFATALIILHFTLLIAFTWTRWTRPSGLSITALASTAFKPLPEEVQAGIYLDTTPSFMMTVILTSIAIGMLCARSLHYQFFAYIAWSTPFLLWKSGLHPILIYTIWAAQEWAWNVYPSTDESSMVVVGCLAVQILAVWQGTQDDFVDKSPRKEKAKGG
ncbi:dolichyl-P-Man:Man(5)GlcNAc(2)-PP-dolichol alpha-1,3-mannosyltransferase [Lecanora helva]